MRPTVLMRTTSHQVLQSERAAKAELLRSLQHAVHAYMRTLSAPSTCIHRRHRTHRTHCSNIALHKCPVDGEADSERKKVLRNRVVWQ